MSKRSKGGWKVIKTLTTEQVRQIRIVDLQGAAESHAEIGAGKWAEEYARRAEALKAQR